MDLSIDEQMRSDYPDFIHNYDECWRRQHEDRAEIICKEKKLYTGDPMHDYKIRQEMALY